MNSHRRGSFLVGSVLFVFIMLFAAAFGADLSLYFYRSVQVQELADSAAKTGAQALNQYTDTPERAEAYQAILQFIEQNQGADHRDLYDVHSPTDVDGISVVRFEPSGAAPYYRVGVAVYDQFEPYFLPRNVFGDDPYPIVKVAVVQVNGRRQTQIVKKPVSCGIFSGRTINLSGNNINVKANADSAAGMCTNRSVLAALSQNGIIGDVVYKDQFLPPGGDHGDVQQINTPRSMVSLQKDEKSDYDVVVDNQTFANFPACGGGGPPGQGPGGGTSKTLVNDDGDPLTWSGGGDVCITRSGSDYEITAQNTGQIQHPDGDAVSLYVDGDLTFTRNGTGVNGALYTAGELDVRFNNHAFTGSKEEIGGMAVWAEGDVNMGMNSLTLEGIAGSEGTFSFTGPPFGGGTQTGYRGLLVSYGGFNFSDNSSNAYLVHDPTLFDYSVLDMKKWKENQTQVIQTPLFATIRVTQLE